MADRTQKQKQKPRRKSFGALLSSSSFSPSHDRAASEGILRHSHSHSHSHSHQHSHLHEHPHPSHAHHQRSASSHKLQKRRPQSSGSASLMLNRTGTMDNYNYTYNHDNAYHDTSSRPRAKSVQKSLSSVLGSYRSRGSVDDDKAHAHKTSSSDEDDTHFKNLLGFQVLHHGEVQFAGGMRRKKQYLVLTDTHLLRFKNQSRAADRFPSIPPTYGHGRAASPSFGGVAANRQSTVSLMSLADGTAAADTPVADNIPLGSVLAVHGADEGKIEICYLEEKAVKPGFLHIQLNDQAEFDLWLGGIRAAACKLNAVEPPVFDAVTVDYVVAALVRERDYNPGVFRMFRVLHRLAVAKRTSSDDPKNTPHDVCYLAIGHHKLHIVPLPKLTADDFGLCLGVMCLSAFAMARADDEFQMAFRVPFLQPFQVHLSSVFCADIALHVWHRAEFLRPQWLFQPFGFNVPRHIYDQVSVKSRAGDEHGFFERTLTAYCASFDIDASNIQYSIDYTCDDAPRFQLLTRQDGSAYSALELVAILRSLRYNETFQSISFHRVNLNVLQNLRDPYEIDYDAMKTRAHFSLRIPDQENLSVLAQEIRALALKSTTLRLLDFSFCLTKDPRLEGAAHDPGCGIPEAIFPLCRRQLTNVDWIVLNGIKLVDADLDYLVDAASQKGSQLRALEISHCGISIHNLNLLLSTLIAQEETLEAVNISGVQGRLSPELFQQQIGYFGNIRKINLSHVSAGSEPLIAPETLLNWKLDELCLTHMTLNEKTISSIAEYLASPQSHTLRTLRLDQCGLTGRDLATLLAEMSDTRPLHLHLHVSENRLHVDHACVFDAIGRNHTPTHLTMRMVEFQREEHFRHLVDALRRNTSLKFLDISKASLPYDAAPETCRALQRMFEKNRTLEELDISGEYAHLEVARFGIGLNLALTGLKKNTSLKVLKIEYQKLGLQGANTLAEVLEANRTLKEVHCENNEVNLQSFTVLVNGLQRNRTVVFLPPMARDRELSLERVRREMQSATVVDGQTKYAGLKMNSFKRTLRAATGRMRSASSTTKTKAKAKTKSKAPSVSASPETAAVLAGLNRKWDEQAARAQRYLYRNYKLSNGEVADEPRDDNWDAQSDGRPASAASMGTMLRQMALGEDIDDDTAMTTATTTATTTTTTTNASTASSSNKSSTDGNLLTRLRSVKSISSLRRATSTSNKRADAPSHIPLPPMPRGIDISRELAASPSPSPVAVAVAVNPHFLRDEDRGKSWASAVSQGSSLTLGRSRSSVTTAAATTTMRAGVLPTPCESPRRERRSFSRSREGSREGSREESNGESRGESNGESRGESNAEKEREKGKEKELNDDTAPRLDTRLEFDDMNLELW